MKTAKLNTPKRKPIVTLGNGKYKYEIDLLTTDTDGNTTAAAVAIVAADTLKQACEYADSKHDRNMCRVYPYCTKADGESQLRLAEHTLASFEKWERRNNNAVLNPYKRNEWDREDYIMLACIAINTILADNAKATMHELKMAAFKAIRNEQAANERKSEREYNPNFIMCNIQPRKARAAIPAVDKLISAAIAAADLTEKQLTAVTMQMDGLSIADIAEHTGVTKRSAAQNVYSAHYKIFTAAVEIDKNLDTLALAGLSGEDIDEIAAILAKRARIKNK